MAKRAARPGSSTRLRGRGFSVMMLVSNSPLSGLAPRRRRTKEMVLSAIFVKSSPNRRPQSSVYATKASFSLDPNADPTNTSASDGSQLRPSERPRQSAMSPNLNPTPNPACCSSGFQPQANNIESPVTAYQFFNTARPSTIQATNNNVFNVKSLHNGINVERSGNAGSMLIWPRRANAESVAWTWRTSLSIVCEARHSLARASVEATRKALYKRLPWTCFGSCKVVACKRGEVGDLGFMALACCAKERGSESSAKGGQDEYLFCRLYDRVAKLLSKCRRAMHAREVNEPRLTVKKGRTTHFKVKHSYF